MHGNHQNAQETNISPSIMGMLTSSLRTLRSFVPDPQSWYRTWKATFFWRRPCTDIICASARLATHVPTAILAGPRAEIKNIAQYAISDGAVITLAINFQSSLSRPQLFSPGRPHSFLCMHVIYAFAPRLCVPSLRAVSAN
jgi:hypothetical protein